MAAAITSLNYRGYERAAQAATAAAAISTGKNQVVRTAVQAWVLPLRGSGLFAAMMRFVINRGLGIQDLPPGPFL
jgi:Tfp pilus assembly major pilin PilA